MYKRMLRRSVFLLLAQTAAWTVAYGADFWYNGAVPSTNRVASASVSKASEAATEFRVLSEVVSAESAFSTYPAGTVLTIR